MEKYVPRNVVPAPLQSPQSKVTILVVSKNATFSKGMRADFAPEKSFIESLLNLGVLATSMQLTCIMATEWFCMYTLGHKKRATFIFSITLANIDGFS